MRKVLRKWFLSRKVCGSFVADRKFIVSACVLVHHGETNTVEAERCCLQGTQCLLEEQLPTASQEDQDSLRFSSKVCGRFAEAPRKGAPCLQASAPVAVAWVAYWSPRLHGLRRSTIFLPYSNSFLRQHSRKQICKACAAEGLQKQAMNHVCRGSSWKGPVGPRQGCGRIRGSLDQVCRDNN